jgi:hypothetical protein
MTEPGMRQCPYCGKLVAVHLRQCPFCREDVPEVPRLRANPDVGRKQIRQGLLLALLMSFAYYLTTDSSPWAIPISVPPLVKQYLLRLACLGGVVIALYGLFLRLRG